MKTTTILLFLLAINLNAIAQNYNYGKISKEELLEKKSAIEEEADAAILYKKRFTNFDYSSEEGWMVETIVHQRIKIYTKEGLDWGTYSILLMKNNNNEEKINSLKGSTYNLVNGKIEKTKLKKSGIFSEDINRYRNKKSLTMPNVKEGSIVEFQYRIRSPFFNIRNVEAQYTIPVAKLEAKIDIPERFYFNQFQKGYYPLNFTPSKKTRKIQYRWREKVGTVLTEGRNGEIEFIENVYEISANNVPSIKEEQYVNNINNYKASFLFELSQYRPKNGLMKNYALSWENVVKTIYDNQSFGSELKKSGYYEDDINQLISNTSDPVSRVALIYNFVKSKVKWDNYYGKYTDRGVRRAYKEQVGNVAEINLMLTSMLRFAGLKANPVLVSTRNNGIPLFPTLNGYNYVVTSVEIPDGVIMLDATNEYSTPNVLPFRALNWEGRIVKDDGTSELINLYPKEKSKNTVSMMVKLNFNGDIEGSIRSAKTNHGAMFYRESYISTPEEQYLEDLENKYNGIEVSDFAVKNKLDLSKPVMETFKFSLENQSDIIEDKMYVSPLFFLATKENPFKLEKRDFPVDFGYPSATKYRINITLPKGYVIESLPESVAYALPENFGMFKYVIANNNNNSIQLTVDSVVNEPIISALYYDALKEFFNKMIEKENEKIVIIKVKP